jgi:hypothetical protein
MDNLELELDQVTVHTVTNSSTDVNDLGHIDNAVIDEKTERQERYKKSEIRRERRECFISAIVLVFSIGIMLPQCFFSARTVYSDVVPCSFDNVTTIKLDGGRFKFHWGYSGFVDVNRTNISNTSNALNTLNTLNTSFVDRLNLNLQLYCGTFKSYYTILECNGNLVSTAEYKILTYEQETIVKDNTGKETYTGTSGSYANTIKNNYGGANYGIKLLKTGKTYDFSGSSLFSVDVVVKDEKGRSIYSVKRDKFPIPSYLEIKQLNTTDYPIQDLLVLVGAQTFYNMGDGDGKNKSSDICNGLCLAGFIIGLMFLVFSLLYIIYKCVTK